MPDLLLNEEERMLQNTIREFANKELAPRASEIDEKEEFSWESWKSLASLGLTGIGIDPAYGGSGGGYRQVSLAMEEIARGDAATSTSLIAHLCLGTRTIFEFGDESQKQRYVPDLAEGNKMAAWALTEPSCGSDAAALQTTADFRDGTYFLNGSKIFITNADTASHVVVFATQDKSLRAKGVGAFVVDPETPGFTVHKQHGKMGMRGSATTEITMENVPVPEANRLGEEGRGFNYAMDILDSSRIIIAA